MPCSKTYKVFNKSAIGHFCFVLTGQRTEVITIGKYLHQRPARRVKSLFLFTQGNKRLQTNVLTKWLVRLDKQRRVLDSLLKTRQIAKSAE